MFCCLLTTSVLFSQTLFAKTFGGTNWDWAQSIVRTTDGGYAVAGWTQSFGASSIDFLVIKLYASGGVEWAKTFQGTNDDRAYSIIQTIDGGYAIAGETYSWGVGNSDFFVLKLNSAGGLEWSRTFGGLQGELAYSIIQTTDRGYAVAGWTWGFGAGASDFLVIKLSSSGGLEWAKTFGGPNSEEAYSIIQTTDGGYLIAGETRSFGVGLNDFLVIKLSSSGDLQWARTFGGTDMEYGKSIIRTTDGGYAVAGYTYTFGSNGDFLVLKLSSTGGLDWARTFGGLSTEQAFSIIQATDGGYAVAGGTYSWGGGGGDFLVLKMGSDGSYPDCVTNCSPIVTMPNLSTSSLTVGADCNPTPNLTTSTTTTPTLTITDVCIPVYESVEENLGGGGFEFRATGQDIYIFMSKQAQVSLTIYDAQGRLVQKLYEGVLTSGSHTFNPKIEANGVYIAVLRYQGGMKSLKIVR